jgi:hypothetical protein
MLHIRPADAALALNWRESDLSTMRRLLAPQLPTARPVLRRVGSAPLFLELRPLMEWLNHILPGGLNDKTAAKLTAASTRIGTIE